MTKKFIIISSIACIVLISIAVYVYIDMSRPDPELNKQFSPLSGQGTIYSYVDSQYYYFYRDKFQNLSIETVPLSMGLHWIVCQYDNVYTCKEDFFYVSAFNTPNISTQDLVKLYNDNPENLYYLKPYLDCYLLMDKDREPSDEDMETIKETILYALDYYINGKDFVGTLDK